MYAVTAIHECGLGFVCGDFYAVELPSGAAVSMSPKLITWTPSADQANKNVPFKIATAPDYCGNSATQSWTVFVSP
jgi:hypothetical protein